MSETKKQSGYQKLKAELEAAQTKIKELESQLAVLNPSEPAA
jgi:predicted  nucleic acid-binding Zn-ribbon protein